MAMMRVDADGFPGQSAVQRTGGSTVYSQLKRHGNGGREHIGHTEKHGTQERRDEADRQPPAPAADESAKQGGDVHRAEHGTDLRNLSGQER